MSNIELAVRLRSLLNSELITCCGDWLNISNEEYHSNKSFLGSSSVRAAQKSGNAFMNVHFGDSKTATDAMNLGTAFHAAILEPELFNQKFILQPTFSGTGMKKAKEEFLASVPPSAFLLTEKQYGDLRGMVTTVQNYPQAKRLISEGLKEVSGFFQCPYTGINCKIRPDIWNPQMSALIDVKTSKSADKKYFAAQVEDGYGLQMAMYALGVKELTGHLPTFCIWFVVENSPPYDVALYTANEQVMKKGIEDYRAAMEIIKGIIEGGAQPAKLRYQASPEEIGRPSWVKAP